MNNFDEPVKKAETDAEILEMFGEDERIVATLEKDPCKTCLLYTSPSPRDA